MHEANYNQIKSEKSFETAPEQNTQNDYFNTNNIKNANINLNKNSLFDRKFAGSGKLAILSKSF